MLEVVLLGEQRISLDGEVLARLSSRGQALLGYLIVHRGAPQARHHVAGVFWPGSTEAQARTNLRRELHDLRLALPEADRCLAVDATSLRWRDDAPCRSDVAEFERAADEADEGDGETFRSAAERAVGWYGGDLLPPLYEDWVLAARDRLDRRCLGLLDRLVATLADRDPRAAVFHAHRRVALDPMAETGYRMLLRLQARSGDRAAAMRTYQRCLSVLEQELGVPPSPETTAVYERLFPSRPRPGPTASPSPALGTALVGRRAEKEILNRAWQGVGAGARLVVMTGEAGVGKTRLADELCLLAQREGAVVVRARCFPGTGRLALGPVAEWLRNPALRPGIEDLDPPWSTEVARLIPEVGAQPPTTPPPSLPDHWQRHRFFEGLARAVLAVGRPAVLVIDDLQWCDRDTLTWLELLMHLGAEAPLLLVATARIVELDDHPDVVAMLRAQRVAGTSIEVEVGPLGVDDTAELAARLHGEPLDPAAAERLHATTGGVPLLIVEVARLLSSTGSGPPPATDAARLPRVHAMLHGRLAQLTPPARELVDLAAVTGRGCSLEVLAEASDLDADTLINAVDETWRRRILRERSPAVYDLSHDLLREVAYGSMTPPRRRLLHCRVARALELLHADDRRGGREAGRPR